MSLKGQDGMEKGVENYSSPTVDWEKQDCIMGIDEAGRGPVLGAMVRGVQRVRSAGGEIPPNQPVCCAAHSQVYGAAWCPIDRKDDLAALGFADSKQLTAEQRQKLLVKIQTSQYIGHSFNVISPEFMSHHMLRRQKYNLNAISHDSAIALIQQALDRGVNLVHVYLDTVGDSNKYETLLRSVFRDVQFTVSKKADSLFPVGMLALVLLCVFR